MDHKSLYPANAPYLKFIRKRILCELVSNKIFARNNNIANSTVVNLNLEYSEILNNTNTELSKNLQCFKPKEPMNPKIFNQYTKLVVENSKIDIEIKNSKIYKDIFNNKIEKLNLKKNLTVIPIEKHFDYQFILLDKKCNKITLYDNLYSKRSRTEINALKTTLSKVLINYGKWEWIRALNFTKLANFHNTGIFCLAEIANIAIYDNTQSYSVQNVEILRQKILIEIVQGKMLKLEVNNLDKNLITPLGRLIGNKSPNLLKYTSIDIVPYMPSTAKIEEYTNKNPYEHLMDRLKGNLIITPTNKDADWVNEYVLDKMYHGPVHEYVAESTLTGNDDQTKLMNSMRNNIMETMDYDSLPKHVIRLKKGVVVQIIRNINSDAGLYNGTNVFLLELGKKSLHGKIMSGQCAGQIVSIPRIRCSQDLGSSIKLTRRQFPIKLGFGSTVHKCQGQTLIGGLIYNNFTN